MNLIMTNMYVITLANVYSITKQNVQQCPTIAIINSILTLIYSLIIKIDFFTLYFIFITNTQLLTKQKLNNGG